MFKEDRKRGLIGAIVTILVISAGAAAYWTAGGGGSGEAETSTTAALTVVQTGTINAMYPGLAPQTLSGTITNPNPGPIQVGTVTATVSSVETVPAGGDCEPNDYVISGAATVNAQALADDTTTWSGGTIAFVNEPAEDQDDCKGATVNLSYAIG